MLDIAWPELLVIGAVALVAIGPKDLPKVMHQLGQWVGKARSMVADVQRTMEQLSYETEIADKLKKQAADSAAEAARDEPFTAPTYDTSEHVGMEEHHEEHAALHAQHETDQHADASHPPISTIPPQP